MKGYTIRKLYVANLVRFFGDKPLTAITAQDVSKYRERRIGYTGRQCPFKPSTMIT
jgi:hypothetical protein